MDQEQTSRPSFGARLGRALFWLFKLAIVIVLGIVVGVSAYGGGLILYRQYLEPVPIHAIRLDLLEGKQDQLADRLNEQRNAWQTRVVAIELQNDARKLDLDELEGRLAAIETPQAAERARLDAAYRELAQLRATATAAQSTREALQANLQSDLDALRAADETGALDRDALRVELEAEQTALADLAEQLAAYGLELDAVSEQLRGSRSPTALYEELQRVKALQWLTRARLVLVQNNLSLAELDLLAARSVLAALQADLPAERAAQIGQAIDYVDRALAALPAAPVAAADQIEGAWQLLSGGTASVPGAPGLAATSPVATPEVSPTPTPASGTATPTAEATPTATPEASPTPTPQS
jgi:hypothetical protein